MYLILFIAVSLISTLIRANFFYYYKEMETVEAHRKESEVYGIGYIIKRTYHSWFNELLVISLKERQVDL